jgi:RNase adapter protein RapZ
VQVAFFEADNVVLVRRYSETRRMHPMGQHELPEAIVRERELLASIRGSADVVIDTSSLASRQLAQLVRDRWGGTGGLRVALVSFAYRGGLPPEADLVLDARILANPNDLPSLRPMTGLHEPVARYVTEQADAQTLLDHGEKLVRFMAGRVQAEGRAYFAVAVGCTGGQHRSVAIVEALKRRLETGDKAPWTRLFVRHRDVGGAGS